MTDNGENEALVCGDQPTKFEHRDGSMKPVVLPEADYGFGHVRPEVAWCASHGWKQRAGQSGRNHEQDV